MAGITIARILGWVWGVLSFGITLPVWVFLAAWLWMHFDKSSAVRQAVDNAVTELVAGAELEAKQASIEALREINEVQAKRLARARLANEMFSEQLSEARQKQQEMDDEIEELRALPEPSGIRLDRGLYDRLRNR